MAHPQTWLEATKHAKESQQVVFPRTKNPLLFLSLAPQILPPPATPLKVQKLTRAEMNERQLKGLCYNCDEKYFPGHKCKEHFFLWPFQRMLLKKKL
jgi:hypothetical protein